MRDHEHMSHTSGPWSVDGVTEYGYSIEHDPAPRSPRNLGADTVFPIHVCEVLDEGLGDGATRANAYLIAAAPDLLKACKRALAMPSVKDSVVGVELRRAIRKARPKTVLAQRRRA